MPAQPQAAKTFHTLHAGPDVLLLPNAWDAVSARVIEKAGAKAIATSSAAVAWAHGFSDGHDLPIAKLALTVEEMARVVSIPISADAEAGYAEDPAQVEKNIALLIDAGAVGINLEDGHEPHALHVKKIEAARKAAARANVDLYINARTDVYLKKLAPPERAVEEVLARAKALKAAGASGLFVPGVVDPKEIKAIVEGAGMPVNVIAVQGLPLASALRDLGVRRLSAGTRLAAIAFAAVRDATTQFLADGDADALTKKAGAPVNYNEYFKR